MTKLDDVNIKKLEAAGGNRWTKGSHDRIYFDATDIGLECSRYGTGNVRSASFKGEGVSNADARGALAAKCWVDVETGEVHVRASRLEGDLRESLEEIVRAAAVETEDERKERIAESYSKRFEDPAYVAACQALAVMYGSYDAMGHEYVDGIADATAERFGQGINTVVNDVACRRWEGDAE